MLRHAQSAHEGPAHPVQGIIGTGLAESKGLRHGYARDRILEEPEARRETLKGMGLDTGSENALVVGAAFLLMYALDDRGLLEHGGGIMGSWPTERGRQFVKLGKKALAEIREPEEKSQGEKT